ncbi:hypothetical protein OG792_14020 [Micromonospora sp. NBC_01699]|uniref:hypothetical protein n=1 Tax=Micromonospora sp. NBC_01699 TaxID=2975984 RepID=UPI002E2F2563|nr:hypothetical protein [Micromonospora sp. NBC_01699]
MQEWVAESGPDVPGPRRIVALDSPARVLLAAASRALRGEDCADLGYQPMLARFPGTPEAVRRAAVARAGARAALPVRQVGQVDAEWVARWMVDHYPAGEFPGVVLGSPSGAAVHLATALGMPWLPAGFEVSVQWPQGAVDNLAGSFAYGAQVAQRLVAANPGIRVRQVHDPAVRGVLAGSTVSLVLRWRQLPEAYRTFLDERLAPGAPVLLLRDVRTWPVADQGQGHAFQLGSPGSGLTPADFRILSEPLDQVLRAAGGAPDRWEPPPPAGPQGYAEHGIEPGFEQSLLDRVRESDGVLHRVLFAEPEALSAATADVYRGWLRAAGKSGDRCVVECGRLLDPWQVIRAGLVPYWCENATSRRVAGAEWWLAGSTPFSSVDVLPEPPGMRSPALAGLPQWLAVASFGRRRRALDRIAARGYPVTSVPTRHATEVLRGQPYDLPAPARLGVQDALAGLRAAGTAHGLLVC